MWLQYLYWTASVIGSTALVATLIFVIRYARAAKAQVEKTHKLVLRAEEQAKATRDLVLQGELATLPNAVGRIVPSEKTDISLERVSGLLFREDYIVILNVEFINFSKGASEFIVNAFPSFRIAEKRGNNIVSRTHNLATVVSGPFVVGKKPVSLKPDETMTGYILINFEDVYDKEATKLGVDNFGQFLFKGSLYVEVYLDYTNERENIGSSKRYYDCFCFYPYYGPTKKIPDGKSLIPGYWVFEGRSEEPGMLDRFISILSG